MPFQVIMPDLGTPALITARICSSLRSAQNLESRKSREGFPAAVSFFPPEPSALWQSTQFFVKIALPLTASPGLTPANAGSAAPASKSAATRRLLWRDGGIESPRWRVRDSFKISVLPRRRQAEPGTREALTVPHERC